jgi:hypothetical protein
MYFPPNQQIAITDITRRFRVRDAHLDTWVREGVLPEPFWIKGRRYWDSNQINNLIAGFPVQHKKQQRIQSSVNIPRNASIPLLTATLLIAALGAITPFIL